MASTSVFQTDDTGSIPVTGFCKKFDFLKFFAIIFIENETENKCASFNARTHPLRVVNVG